MSSGVKQKIDGAIKKLNLPEINAAKYPAIVLRRELCLLFRDIIILAQWVRRSFKVLLVRTHCVVDLGRLQVCPLMVFDFRHICPCVSGEMHGNVEKMERAKKTKPATSP